MKNSTICYGAIVPSCGFRWIYKEDDGQWSLRAPPDDWPDTDYRAHAHEEENRLRAELTKKFHLAMGLRDVMQVHHDLHINFGRMICEPDLYLRFASTRPTPSAILALANTYGFLRHTTEANPSYIQVDRDNSPDLYVAFPPTDAAKGKPDVASLIYVESADEWLTKHGIINSSLRAWARYQADQDLEQMSGYLEDGYNYAMGGSLTYQAKIDPNTGRSYSDIIASSLADMLEVQWGMSVVNDVDHRQCSECQTWFSINPGAGRPEKRYCSDACRMRAYRRRKLQRLP